MEKACEEEDQEEGNHEEAALSSMWVCLSCGLPVKRGDEEEEGRTWCAYDNDKRQRRGTGREEGGYSIVDGYVLCVDRG